MGSKTRRPTGVWMPGAEAIELARVKLEEIRPPVTAAANACDPQDDEISLLFRPLGLPHCFADARLAELPAAGLGHRLRGGPS